jgi:hypothetical protein
MAIEIGLDPCPDTTASSSSASRPSRASIVRDLVTKKAEYAAAEGMRLTKKTPRRAGCSKLVLRPLRGRIGWVGAV